MLEVRVEPTRYTVSCLPEDFEGRDSWDLTVELRSPGQWAVCWRGECLSKSGRWSRERQPSARTDHWKRVYRHDLDTALALARKYAPRVTINGYTPAAALALEEAEADQEVFRG
ncbi:hypothetical protein [Allonocardiopsis opalescens]|uniref:Uncharacterized protein n=1 Tax=Allonocardiopsis opalescens TaxID=1144618 RepID=A0A2T0PSQ9_9ACTN|nr:hypothetical protein [Allonocardiopsis opalescens]PRX91929.1 hypothetical protein CLV72_1122 [Allonocardiopsis opalescens]